jgi:translation initiation factor IF-3
MDIAQARAVAEEAGLDLIEVAPDGDPPVCRLLDWGRFRYEQKKKVKDAQKRSKQTEVKDLRVRPNTSTHDIDFKTRNAIKFLQKGHKVNFTVIFRGPELRHKDIGRDQLLKIAEGCKDYGEIEVQPRMEGRRMLMMLVPAAGAAEKDSAEQA